MLCVILINSKDILNLLSTSDNIDNVMRYIDKFKRHPNPPVKRHPNPPVKRHPGVMKIKDVINIDKTFNFDFIDIKNMTKTIYSLETTKSNPINSIPAKITIDNGDIFIPILHNNFNNNIINGIFPLNLKLSDITPTHKKKDRILKENYRPISILPAVSKIYEKLMAEQPIQCGFRKGFNAQHCLIYMIEKWKRSLDKKGEAGALLTDLSKAFDCLNHGLLIAKLEAHGVG